jgi:hypothetical protein
VKTQIVYRDGRHYRRAALPSPEAAANHAAVALYQPAYVQPAGKRGYINFATGKVTERREPARRVPQAVLVGSRNSPGGHHRYFFERGSVPKVRVISAEHQTALADLDARIAALEQERRDLAEDAYARGRHLRLDDVIEGTAAFQAERARLAEKEAP